MTSFQLHDSKYLVLKYLIQLKKERKLKGKTHTQKKTHAGVLVELPHHSNTLIYVLKN